jgi:hypothetical protein
MAADRNSPAAPRATLIALAREWYAAGKVIAGPVPRLPKPAVNGYPSESWEDDMAAGAAALARTTGESSFLSDAGAYLAASGTHYGFGWEDNGSFAAADLCGALGAPSIADAGTRSLGCSKLAEAAAVASRNARRNGFGMAGVYTWGTTAENASFGTAAALAGRVGASADGTAVGAGARDWLLGRNRWGASFIAGFGPRAPRKLHHWAKVFGGGLPTGAVVGGPAPPKQITGEGFELRGKFRRFNNKRAAYEDRRANYVTSEPAIDYTGASILLLAALNSG